MQSILELPVPRECDFSHTRRRFRGGHAVPFNAACSSCPAIAGRYLEADCAIPACGCAAGDDRMRAGAERMPMRANAASRNFIMGFLTVSDHTPGAHVQAAASGPPLADRNGALRKSQKRRCFRPLRNLFSFLGLRMSLSENRFPLFRDMRQLTQPNEHAPTRNLRMVRSGAAWTCSASSAGPCSWSCRR